MRRSCSQYLRCSLCAQANAQVRILLQHGYKGDFTPSGYPADFLLASICSMVCRLTFQQVLTARPLTAVVKLLHLPGADAEPVLFKFYYRLQTRAGRIRLIRVEIKSHFGNRSVDVQSSKQVPSCSQMVDLVSSPIWISSAGGIYEPFYCNGNRVLEG